MAQYVCPECDSGVEAGPFRMTCPTCGRRLANRGRVESDLSVGNSSVPRKQ